MPVTTMALLHHDLESMHPTLERELPRIVARVQAARPGVPTDEIEAIVTAEVQRLAEARVHDFLPILVERAACAALDCRSR